MFETGIRQFRLAMSMVWGGPINPRVVERLIADALDTLAEFGSPGDDVNQLLEGPFSDPNVREEFQTRALRRTAKRLAERSPFYSTRLSAFDVAPDKLSLADVHRIPATTKSDLIEAPEDFLCRGSTPYLTTRTTGTSGVPAEIWLSRYEAELWPALAGLSGLLRGEISPTDCMQVNISSRATAAVQQNVTLCRLVGARVRILGVISAEQSLDALLTGGDEAPTLLATYPSYLAELVNAARRRGLSAADFRLRRIDVGGEMLSSSLARAARETFGVPTVNDTFAMTEILPVSGRSCEAGHLHHDLNMGLVEVIGLDSAEPAAPGELGSVVVTPFFPYRECMPVLRYETRDVVRRLPDAALTCDLAGIPATTSVLGKAGQLAQDESGVVTTRDLVEIYEGLPNQPWPARFRATSRDGLVHLTVPSDVFDGLDRGAVVRRYAERGFRVEVDCVPSGGPEARELRTLRSDLLETTFQLTGV